MSISGIHGQLLEVTVAGCSKLKDTEWISRQDPYVCLEYASTKFRTRTCTDGGKNPSFQEKFVFTLIEGLRELNVVVWNSNTLSFDDFIGSGKIQLQKALTQGYDDSSWPLQTKTGRYAGEVRLIIHFANANKPTTSYHPSAPPFAPSHVPQVLLYSTPPPTSQYPPPSFSGYPAPSPYPSYPHSDFGPPPPNPNYPPPPSAYAPPPHAPPPHAPPPHAPYYPPGSYPGMYPPPPY